MKDWITIRFDEKILEANGGSAALVRVEIEAGDDVRHPGVLVFSVDEWDRIWRSLVDAAGPFERRGISLERRHAPERI